MPLDVDLDKLQALLSVMRANGVVRFEGSGVVLECVASVPVSEAAAPGEFVPSHTGTCQVGACPEDGSSPTVPGYCRQHAAEFMRGEL